MLDIKQQVKHLGRSLQAVIVTALAVVVAGVAPAQVLAQASSANNRQQLFESAAQEFGVPKEILMAVSYNQTRWENHKGKPSVGGGYGLMHLTSPTVAKEQDGRGDPSRPVPATVQTTSNSLDEAAKLIGNRAETVKSDDTQNVRAGAALLAKYAKEANGGVLPGGDGDWYGAVTRISGATNPVLAQDFADAVYDAVQKGISATTTDGQKLALTPKIVQPNKGQGAAGDQPSLLNQDEKKQGNSRQSETECPRTITCKFVPARYAQNNPANPADYGNYDVTNRPQDMKIKYIVIHDTEGSYQSAIDWFQDPRSYVAAHYVIRSSDGEVTQMVKNKDTGWHAGNWYMNMHSIGVEHEGFAEEGGQWYTEAMYRSSAKLVRYLAEKYDIPLDRQHIVGHEQYHGLTPARAKLMHNDPGPFWDWDYYMDLLHGYDGTRSDKDKRDRADNDQSRSSNNQNWNDSSLTRGHGPKALTITPRFAKNQPVVSQCVSGVCTDLPKQPANFVYLRTEPRADALLLTDAGLHPDGAPGTTDIDDWSARAFQGQNFAVAGQQGDWTAIWFGGQKGWFYNPMSWRDRTATPTWAQRISPKPGAASVPIYGRPVPEAAAYKNGVPPLTLVPLQYTIPAGQSYVAYDRRATNDYFHNIAFDHSSPGDGTLIVGEEKFIPIEYNHRQAFVKASDVDLSWW